MPPGRNMGTINGTMHGREFCIFISARSEIGVNQSHAPTKTRTSNGELLLGLAQKNVIAIRCAFGVGVYNPVKHEHLAVRHRLSKMIKSAPVAQTKIKHRPGYIGKPAHGIVQAVALGLHAADKTVETAHMNCPTR